MSKVSNRTISDVVRFLIHKGNELESIFDPANFCNVHASDLEEIKTMRPRLMVPWKTYAAVTNGLEKFFPSDAEIREYMLWSIEMGAEWTAAFRPVAKLFSSPKTIYSVTEWASKILFSNVKTKITFHSNTSATFVLTLRPDDLPSPFFFRLTAGAMEVIPVLIGFEPSKVKLSGDQHTAIVDIEIRTSKRSSSLLSFFSIFKAMFSAGSLVKHLSTREDEIRQQQAELVAARDDLEQEVNNRTVMLANVNHQLRALLDNSPDIVTLINRDRNISYINRTTANFRRDDVIGKCCLDFIPNTQKAAYAALLENVFKNEQAGTIELTITDNSIFMTRVVPILEGNKVKHVMAISTDISEKKKSEIRLEEARSMAFAASRAKSAFLANVSHEIRTPLTSVIGFAELLATNPQGNSELHADYCARILANGKHLLGLVNDILDISKIEAGTVTLTADKFFAPAVIDEVVQMFKVQASGKSLNLIDDSSNLPAVELTGDVSRFRQVLINLISNALKFTTHGSVKISSNSYPVTKNTETFVRVEVTVTDTGCGIDLENSGYLFQPFEQADTSNVRKYGGTGLGLFLSKQIARQLGGDLVLTSSTLEKGSVFTFSSDFRGQMPAAATAKDPGRTKAPSPSPAITRGAGQKILLVEDNDDLAQLIRIQLEAAGYSTSVANDGQAAVAMAKANTPDLVLMDLQLPILDGYGATREMRAYGIKAPIIALTANAREEDRSRCLEMGFSDYWSKPMQRHKLLNAIAAAFVV